MPSFATQNNINFVKGLITEAGKANFPENASVDELNCDLKRTGNRRRRLGISVEAGTTPSVSAFTRGNRVTVSEWVNVGGQTSVDFVVVRIGRYLTFYDKSEADFSNGAIPVSFTDATTYILDLETYARPNNKGLVSTHMDFASVKGELVVVSEELNPIKISRDPLTGAFTVTQITFRIRDFTWLGDTSTYYETAPRTSDQREYDTRNAGWNELTTLDTYYTAENELPALTLPWHSGRDVNDNFSVTEFKKFANEAQTTLIANGKYILDLFLGNREEVSGISGLGNSPEATRFSSVAGYAGRMFYSGLSSAEHNSRVFFSKTIENTSELGDCFSQNDPTAETISDLLDSDGGYITITEANNIKKLFPYNNTLLVFADNGVWAIDGVDGVFRATEFRIRKISSEGLLAPSSFVDAGGTPLFWTYSGIYTYGVSQVGDPLIQDLSTGTIQTFWDEISLDKKVQVNATYDTLNKRVFWFYPNEVETVDFKCNKALVLDLSLQAFFPWEVKDTTGTTPYVVGASYYKGGSAKETVFTVVDSAGNTIVDSSGNEVTVTRNLDTFDGETTLKVLTFTADNKLQWATFSSPSFLDWGSADYSSFAISRYDLLGSMTQRKQAPYIFVYQGITETGWEASGSGYVPVRQGSCRVSSFWDYKSSASSASQQSYRFKFPLVPDASDLNTFNYPTDTLQTKLRLRGAGRVLSLKFESETGKDFDLIGWGLVGEVNERF